MEPTANPTDTDLTPAIASQALEPIATTADGQSNTGRTSADLIKAQQFLDAKAAVRKRRRGIVYTRMSTPGPLDDCGRARGFDGGIY